MEGGTHTLAHVESSKSAAAGGEDKERDSVMRKVSVETLVEGPALREVCSQRFDLHQRAHHYEHVKDLVALPDEITPPREQTLWVRAAEEIGAD